MLLSGANKATCFATPDLKMWRIVSKGLLTCTRLCWISVNCVNLKGTCHFFTIYEKWYQFHPCAYTGPEMCGDMIVLMFFNVDCKTPYYQLASLTCVFTAWFENDLKNVNTGAWTQLIEEHVRCKMTKQDRGLMKEMHRQQKMSVFPPISSCAMCLKPIIQF